SRGNHQTLGDLADLAAALTIQWLLLFHYTVYAAIDKHGDMVFYFQGHRCSPCPENWLQHGEDCYFLSTKWKTWQESKALCSSLNSRFLKIESKEELVMSYSSYSFWIALSRKGADGSWLWEDETVQILAMKKEEVILNYGLTHSLTQPPCHPSLTCPPGTDRLYLTTDLP
uniref:C-type lectin domain-containing protein n=1 Tax=Chelonoidis abingdonii TaxID=106734 RepID=A0A8C0G3J6_CHEAB